MKCPQCKTKDNRVLETRKYASFIHRRRMCKTGHTFITIEKLTLNKEEESNDKRLSKT